MIKICHESVKSPMARQEIFKKKIYNQYIQVRLKYNIKYNLKYFYIYIYMYLYQNRYPVYRVSQLHKITSKVC